MVHLTLFLSCKWSLLGIKTKQRHQPLRSGAQTYYICSHWAMSPYLLRWRDTLVEINYNSSAFAVLGALFTQAAWIQIVVFVCNKSNTLPINNNKVTEIPLIYKHISITDCSLKVTSLSSGLCWSWWRQYSLSMRVRPACPFLLWHQNLNIVINEQCQGFLLPKHTTCERARACVCVYMWDIFCPFKKV